MAKLLSLVEAGKLGNVRIYDDDARELLPRLETAAFQRYIYLLYPDPWPKARHQRRRFVNEAALDEIHRLLEPGGLFLWFASDIADYGRMDNGRRGALHGGFAAEGDPAEPFENWFQTRYEAKAKREGRETRYLSFAEKLYSRPVDQRYCFAARSRPCVPGLIVPCHFDYRLSDIFLWLPTSRAFLAGLKSRRAQQIFYRHWCGAWLCNWPLEAGLEKKADALVFATLPHRFTANALAIRSTGYRHGSKDKVMWDDLCLRMLLNQQANAIIIAHSIEASAPIDFSEKALSYKLGKRPHCPEIKLEAGNGNITIDGEKYKSGAKNATELMRFEIAKGNCLIEQTAQLADADVVVSIGSIAQGKDAFAAGLDLAADTVRADRIQVYVEQAQQFEEAYRWTGVQTAKLFPILIPTVISGYGLKMRTGFLRLMDHKNIDSKFYHGPDRGAFFTKKLGLDLALRPDNADMETRNLVIAALDSTGQIDPSHLNLIEDYFQGLQEVKVIGNEDAALVVRALADKRVLIPRSLWAVVRNAKGQPAKYFVQLADIFFARLHEADLFPDGKFDHDWAERLGPLGNCN